MATWEDVVAVGSNQEPHRELHQSLQAERNQHDHEHGVLNGAQGPRPGLCGEDKLGGPVVEVLDERDDDASHLIGISHGEHALLHALTDDVGQQRRDPVRDTRTELLTQNGVVVRTPHPQQGHQQVPPLRIPPSPAPKKCSSLSSAGRSGSPATGVRVAAVASARARTASTPITGRSGVGSTPAPLIRQGFRPSRSIARALDGWREQARTQKMILGCNVLGADMDGNVVSRTPRRP